MYLSKMDFEGDSKSKKNRTGKQAWVLTGFRKIEAVLTSRAKFRARTM